MNVLQKYNITANYKKYKITLIIQEVFMKKFKRAAALAIVIIWAALIITTLITAFIDNETAHTLFKGLIFTDIVLPVVAYAMMLMYKYLSGRRQ